MIRGSALGHGLEPDVGGTLLEPELARLPHHHAAVDPPHLAVLLPVFLRLELEDGDAGLLAVSGGEAEVLHGGFFAALRTRVDVASCPHLRRRTRIEHGLTLGAFSEHIAILPCGDGTFHGSTERYSLTKNKRSSYG